MRDCSVRLLSFGVQETRSRRDARETRRNKTPLPSPQCPVITEDQITVISQEMHVSSMTIFGMRVPVGPKCCGRDTVLFRQEPLAGDDTRTRQHFRCVLCRDVAVVIVDDAERADRAPFGAPVFCRQCRCTTELRLGQFLLLL